MTAQYNSSLTTSVGVHDVSLERTIAVADEGDPPAVQQHQEDEGIPQVPCEVSASCSVAFHDIDPLPSRVLRESDLRPSGDQQVRRRASISWLVFRSSAFMMRCRGRGVAAPTRPLWTLLHGTRSAAVGRTDDGRRYAEPPRSAPVGADRVAPVEDRPPVRRPTIWPRSSGRQHCTAASGSRAPPPPAPSAHARGRSRRPEYDPGTRRGGGCGDLRAEHDLPPVG